MNRVEPKRTALSRITFIRTALCRTKFSRLAFMCIALVCLTGSQLPIFATAPTKILMPKGFIDEFGQNSKADWPGKVHNEKELLDLDTEEQNDLAKIPPPPDRDEFQAWRDGPQREGTGFFRIEKINDRWWFVAPNGHLFFSTGIDCVGEGHSTKLGTINSRYYKWLPEPEGKFAPACGKNANTDVLSTLNMYLVNLIRKWDDQHRARSTERALSRMRSWGFTSLGNWCDERVSTGAKFPYVSMGPETWELTVPFIDGDIPDVYEKNFEPDAIKAASKLSVNKDDKYLIGYFIDNELPWWNIPYDVFAMKADAPAKRAWLSMLKAKYGSSGDGTPQNSKAIDKLNASWKTKFKDFNQIRWPGDKANQNAKADIVPLMKDFADRFYRTWYKATKQADPNHLVLGSRIPYPMDEIVSACAANTDVLSFNHYAIELHKDFDRYYREIGKPMLIGEYGFDSFDAGLLTAYVPVASQNDRGKGFSYYTEQCAGKPYFIGAHYFQYIDEPLTGRGDGETSFNGFVSITDTVYPELVNAARTTNARIYKVHAGEEAPEAQPPKPVR